MVRLTNHLVSWVRPVIGTLVRCAVTTFSDYAVWQSLGRVDKTCLLVSLYQ